MKKIGSKLGLILTLFFLFSCQIEEANQTTIHLWHQMNPAQKPLLEELIGEFEANNPNVKVVPLQKGTEELRTGFQSAAAFTGGGPEIVYGPMDQIGSFEVMKLADSEKSIIRPLENLFPQAFLEKFSDLGLVNYRGHLYMIADRLGNHLAFVYNKRLLRQAGFSRPPRTISEMIEYGEKLTKDLDGDGRIDQWGLVWNYSEPFWFIPFFYGYGGQVFDENGNPNLNSEAAIKAFQLMSDLRNKYKVIPEESDYNIADNKFSQGKAAMLINGDWSWQKYIDSPDVEFGLTRIPKVEATGKWSSPMVSATGYSINTHAKGKELQASIELIKFLTSEYAQRRFAEEHKLMPSLKTLHKDPQVMDDPVMRASASQIEVGSPMPIVPEMRAAWDAMRPALQNVLGGNMTPEEAAAFQQQKCKEKITSMYSGDKEVTNPSWVKYLLYAIGAAVLLWLTYLLVFKFILALTRDPHTLENRNSRFAVWMALPAAIVMFAVVVYPFAYNIVISFSNMAMTNVNSWEITGLQQYGKVFSEFTTNYSDFAASMGKDSNLPGFLVYILYVLKHNVFFTVFLKTFIWTFVNVFFHVSIGVLLAVLLNRHLPGKSIFRVLLILPWAIPQYITALTWRGMFISDTGAINLLLNQIGLAGLNWLSDPNLAFAAAIITNIWLGFPFMMMIALGGLQSIPYELYEAAEVDGASSWKQFWKITLPLLKPVMVPAITLGIVWTFNNLNVIWLVTNGGQPADKSHILVSYVYRAAFNLYRYGYAAAFSMIIFVILAVFGITFMNKSNVAEKEG